MEIMEEQGYIVKDNFEKFLFIELTEACNEATKNSGYSMTRDWCGFLKNYIFSINPKIVTSNNMSRAALGLDNLHKSVKDKFGMSQKDIAKYFIIYFKYELWNKYLKYVQAKDSYFG
jgi:hypothetical protein